MDEDLTYKPDGAILRKLYPTLEITKDVLSGFGRAKPIIPNPLPYIRVRNLASPNGEESTKHPAIEVGIKGTF